MPYNIPSLISCKRPKTYPTVRMITVYPRLINVIVYVPDVKKQQCSAASISSVPCCLWMFVMRLLLLSIFRAVLPRRRYCRFLRPRLIIPHLHLSPIADLSGAAAGVSPPRRSFLCTRCSILPWTMSVLCRRCRWVE